MVYGLATPLDLITSSAKWLPLWRNLKNYVKETQLHLQTFEPLVIAGIQDKLDKNVVYMN